MKIEIDIPDDLLRIRDLLKIAQELSHVCTERGPIASGALKDSLDAALLAAGRSIANYALVSVEESR